MQTREVKGMVLGSGVPKTIVSLMGESAAELAEQVRKGLEKGVDCFEYRADFAADTADFAALVAQARELAQMLPNNLLLFTFRTRDQGGRADLSAADMRALLEAVIADGAVDAIDIESWLGDEAVAQLCRAAQAAGMLAVVSYHNFAGTPPAAELEGMLLHFAYLGADIPKVAVMAQEPVDALALLQATSTVCASGSTGPLLTMAMGAQGSLTRLVGQQFGSALTFCALDDASAPGQVEVGQARTLMQQLGALLG